SFASATRMVSPSKQSRMASSTSSRPARFRRTWFLWRRTWPDGLRIAMHGGVRTLTCLLALFGTTSFAGCTPPNLTERLTDASYNLNQATRFGRMDVALENVTAKARDEFAKQHASWGRGLRVDDVEMTGLSMTAINEADVFVSVSWQRADESTLRVTHL